MFTDVRKRGPIDYVNVSRGGLKQRQKIRFLHTVFIPGNNFAFSHSKG